MFRSMILATLVAGILAGVLFSVAEQVLTVPIIVEAEGYENAALELMNEPDSDEKQEQPQTRVTDDKHKEHAHDEHGNPVVDEKHEKDEKHSNNGHLHDGHYNGHLHGEKAFHNASKKQDVDSHDEHDEHADKGHSHGEHAHASADADSGFAGFSERTLYTLLASVLTGITFALLLVAGMTFYGKGNARTGLLWGLAGYFAFFISPSLGLVPELPGTAAAAIEHRQLWWVLTVIAAITGLALLAFAQSIVLKGVGLLLLAVPHIIGAPMPAQHMSLAPEALARAFMWMTALANFILWITLGVLTGFLLNRFKVINNKVSD